jgi:hypothetical protein
VTITWQRAESWCCRDIAAQHHGLSTVTSFDLGFNHLAGGGGRALTESDVRRRATEGRGGGAVGSVGVLRSRRCHLRAGFQQCKSFVEMGTVRCCPL